MFNFALFSVLAGSFFVFVFSNMIAPGKWEVKMIEECDNAKKNVYRCQAERHPTNRSHAHFDADCVMREPLDNKIGCKISICKVVDGGCKDYHTMTDQSILALAKKTAEENFNDIRGRMGIEKEDYIDAGHYELKRYLVDYCELPCESVIGEFGVEVLLLDQLGMVMGCIRGLVEFRELNDDEEVCTRCLEEED